MSEFASFDPESPILGDRATVFEVYRYDREAEGDDRFIQLLNVKCRTIRYGRGAVPATAVFEYIFDNNITADENGEKIPSQPEDVWPLDAEDSPYTVLMDDELLVYAVAPEDGEDGGNLVFDGFATIPQMNVGDGGMSVTFTAQGVPVRLWDTVIKGSKWRNSYESRTGDPIDTDLPPWFNPEGHPNASLDGHDVNEGDDDAYPVFVDPALKAAPESGDGSGDGDTDDTDKPQRMWTLPMLIRYFAWTMNADEKYVKNPSTPNGESLDDFIQSVKPNDGEFFDLEDSSTYTKKPIIVRNFNPAGKAWPVAVAELLSYHGFEMFFNTTEDDGGNPTTEFIIFRKDGMDGAESKELHWPVAGSNMTEEYFNVSRIELSREMSEAANQFSVATKPRRFEAGIVLACLFEPSGGDAADADTIKQFDKARLSNADANMRKKYRLFGADEDGSGHWSFESDSTVTGEPIDLSGLFGEPDEDGTPAYVARRRKPLHQLFSADGSGVRRQCELAISTDYDGPYPAVWNQSGTWRSLSSSGWKLLHDQIGIEIIADNPESWRLPRNDGSQAPGDMVQVITRLAAPTTELPRFSLRLTCVIESDHCLDATAEKRDASPMQFAVERNINARDQFRRDTISGSSPFAATPGITTDARDDTQDAQSLADSLRGQSEFPSIGGSVVIPWITQSYGIGDFIAAIAGREIDLIMNAGENAGESPQYPAVVGVTFDCDAQTTTIDLADERAKLENEFR